VLLEEKVFDGTKSVPHRPEDSSTALINGLILILMVLTQVFGDLLLSYGMKSFGAVQALTPNAVFNLMGYLLTSPSIVLGVMTLVLSLGCYLVAISRFDLSYVLPIHASGYVFNAFFAWMLLGEHISILRWVATVMVAVGVYLINRSGHHSPPPHLDPKTWNPKKSLPAPLFLLTTTTTVSPIWLGLAVLVLADAAGDVLLAKGMKRIGWISLKMSPSAFLKVGRQIVTSPSILQGISAQAIAFFAFLCLLSWADVSYVRPTTALTYAVSLLGARYVLHEQVVPGRLLGSLVIGLGVALVALS
jgi:bacterial/archaeal transporter family protein